jgi:signal transduction histidine kinase
LSFEGISASEGREQARTELVSDIENATSIILKFYANTKGKMDVCSDRNWFSIVNDVKLYNTAFHQMKAKGVKFRIISEIIKENISHCKKVIEWAEVRHFDSISGNFGLSETEFIVSTSALNYDKPVTPVFCTNVREIVEHQQQMFDILWNLAVPAGQKIQEIEEGTKPEIVEIIQDCGRAELLLLSGVEDARSEILVVISSFSFLRHLANIGLIDKMAQARNKGVHIMMICPNTPDEYRTEGIDEGNDRNDEIRALVADIRKYVEVQDKGGMMKGSVFVFDNDKVLTILGDKNGSRDFALFSNSKSLISSYTSLFETFWDEKEMLRSVLRAKKELMDSNALLLAANEQLKVKDKLQKEFINIAAHELRTPIQPILGVLSMYDISAKDEEEIRVRKSHMRMIARNARRLAHLSSDILDASRIENNSLYLNVKKRVNLVKLASDAIKDAQKSVGDRIEFVVNSPEGAVFVDADWSRLTQVLHNLLSNAVEFTAAHGVISVTIEKTRDNEAKITVADTGNGIDPEVMPRLFQKFASKTDAGSGTGLGLFISKAIVEAHGGRIWAENNANGKGATFYFTLPT